MHLDTSAGGQIVAHRPRVDKIEGPGRSFGGLQLVQHRLALALDAEELDDEDERRTLWDVGWVSVFAIGEIGWDVQLPPGGAMRGGVSGMMGRRLYRKAMDAAHEGDTVSFIW